MRILVISVTRNRKGQPVRAERIVDGEMIRLGRGTQCEIHLPDPRVALFHAAIYRQGDSIFIHAPEAELAVDGGPEREARLTPRVHIALGPYEMTVEPPPPGRDLALGPRCSACDETPFVHVRDHVCIDCHVKTPGHVQTVALQSKLFGGTRCANCHADHKGADALVRRDPDLCATCHSDLKRYQADTRLGNATDFAVNHPPFKLTLWQGPNRDDLAR